jgi:cell division transport system permease protein
MFQTIRSVLNKGWINFRRNHYLSVAATGIMSLSLVLFLGLLATQFITNKVVVSLQEKVDISAYFKTDATEEDIMKMKSDLSARADIKSVDYTSREQALEEFKKRHEGDPLIQESLAQLDENPLAASLNIKTQNIGQYASIVSFLEGSKFKEFIDKINFYENQTVIERIEKLSMSLKTWGLTAIALIALIAALVTFNTVRLTIYNQKREIEIMRLVGASNWHIRGPYLVEGGFYGLFAALIALAVFYPIVYAVSDKITYFTEAVDLQKYFVGGVIQIVPLTVLLGMTLGTLSSLIAIRKHLKN